MFMIENDLENNYIYFIGIGTTRGTIINQSFQFVKYNCPRESRSLANYLKRIVIESYFFKDKYHVTV